MTRSNYSTVRRFCNAVRVFDPNNGAMSCDLFVDHLPPHVCVSGENGYYWQPDGEAWSVDSRGRITDVATARVREPVTRAATVEELNRVAYAPPIEHVSTDSVASPPARTTESAESAPEPPRKRVLY